MKIHPVGANFFPCEQTDGPTAGQTDRQQAERKRNRCVEAKSHFSQFCERA